MDEIIIKCTPTQANMILENLAYGDQCPYYGECGEYTECYKCLKDRIRFDFNGGDADEKDCTMDKWCKFRQMERQVSRRMKRSFDAMSFVIVLCAIIGTCFMVAFVVYGLDFIVNLIGGKL